jgi:hypothetical protein
VAEIDVALKSIIARADLYALYRRYYEGEHRLAFATEKYRSAFGGLFAEFADNLCPRVVDALADRLQIVDFGIEQPASNRRPADMLGGVQPDAPAQSNSAAMELWTANRMDQRAGQTMQEALIEGDSYLLVWPENAPGSRTDGLPTFYPQSAAEVYVHYDVERPGVIQWAAKLWFDEPGKRWRITLYYPDRIEKWVTVGRSLATPTSAARFIRYTEDGAPWPIPNEYDTVPMFHFANNTRRLGLPGASELQHIIPLQDALNKAVTDMLVTMEFSAYRQRWISGIEIRYDPLTNLPINPFNPGADRIWFAGENATFGEFAQTDLSQFLAVQDNFRTEIARVSATPLHYFMLTAGNFPSGEAMKTAEAPFAAKVADRQITFGNVWEDVVSLALRMEGQPDVRLTTVWKDTTPVTIMAQPGAQAQTVMPSAQPQGVMQNG